MNTKTGKPLRCRSSHTHTCRLSGCDAGRVCACLRVTDAVLKKKKSRTSLPRELSAIADLNLHRYISALRAASELLWLPLQKQVHFFVFSGTKKNLRGPQQSASRNHLNAYTSQGFYRKTGHTLRVHVNTVLPQNHTYRTAGRAGRLYDHSNRE